MLEEAALPLPFLRVHDRERVPHPFLLCWRTNERPRVKSWRPEYVAYLYGAKYVIVVAASRSLPVAQSLAVRLAGVEHRRVDHVVHRPVPLSRVLAEVLVRDRAWHHINSPLLVVLS